MAKKETWKQCRGWSAYDVSTSGRIRTYWQMAATASTVDRGKKPVVMKPSRDDGGRLFVIVHDAKGNKKNAVLARLVLDTFGATAGTKRDKIEYADGRRSNVTLANIKYVRRGPVKRKGKKAPTPAKTFRQIAGETVKKAVKLMVAEAEKDAAAFKSHLAKKAKKNGTARKPAAKRAA